MSILKKIFVLLLLTTTCQLLAPKNTLAQYATVSFQVFYDELSPYGTWIDYPEYGYVWMPRGYAGFSPYFSNGHWAYTDFGWMWVSYYPWGWAPFHYGRWMYDPVYAWIWLPDPHWGPAWVVWRSGGGYCGWAPMGPQVGVNFSFRMSIPHEHWVFAEEKYLGEKNISTYYGPRTKNKDFIKTTEVVKNTYDDKTRNTTYVTGPYREEVERVSGRPIKSIAVKENDKPGQKIQDNQLSIYRPLVQPPDRNAERPAPAKAVKPENKNANEPKHYGPGLDEKGREPEPEKIPPARKDKLPVPHPGEISPPPKENPPAAPRERPQVNPPRHRPMPESPRQERQQVNPPKREIPQPAPGPEINPRTNPPAPGNHPERRKPGI